MDSIRVWIEVGGILLATGGVLFMVRSHGQSIRDLGAAYETMRKMVADHERDAVTKREMILQRISDVETEGAKRDAEISELKRGFDRLDITLARMDQKIDRLIERQ